MRMLRFLVTGGITFILYFGIYAALDRLGASALTSISVAYGVAITFHYFSNRTFTFQVVRAGSSVEMAQLLRYVVVNAINYVLTLIVVYVARAIGYDTPVGMLVAIIVTTFFGYLLYNVWVFKRNTSRAAASAE